MISVVALAASAAVPSARAGEPKAAEPSPVTAMNLSLRQANNSPQVASDPTNSPDHQGPPYVNQAPISIAAL